MFRVNGVTARNVSMNIFAQRVTKPSNVYFLEKYFIL